MYISESDFDMTKEILIGSSVSSLVGGGRMFPISLYVPKDGNINIILGTDKSDCSLALLARRHTPPKLTAHDFLQSLGEFIIIYIFI